MKPTPRNTCGAALRPAPARPLAEQAEADAALAEVCDRLKPSRGGMARP